MVIPGAWILVGTSFATIRGQSSWILRRGPMHLTMQLTILPIRLSALFLYPGLDTLGIRTTNLDCKLPCYRIIANGPTLPKAGCRIVQYVVYVLYNPCAANIPPLQTRARPRAQARIE